MLSSSRRVILVVAAVIGACTLAVRAQDISNADAEVQYQLGNLLSDETRYQEALAAFDRANPRPVADEEGRLSAGQRSAIDRYAEDVTEALKSLLRKQRLSKPSVPEKSYAEIYPERGLDIVTALFRPDPLSGASQEERVPRTAAVVAAETIPGLSLINPRDAVIKNAKIFSDVWALGIAWDYASYILMLAYLFFPSAERAAGRKDGN